MYVNKLSIQFLRENGRKIRKLNMNRHKTMGNINRICQNNNIKIITVNPKNVCKMEFADNLWLPFLDQPRSDVVVFEIISFGIYIIL